MRKRIFSFFFLALVTSVQALAGVTVNPNVKSGDIISGDFTFKIGVESENLVTSVEFYVGSDLRETDDSTPYEFNLDTLSETQGEIEVTFAAYTKAGESAKKTLRLKIDNELDKGLDFHIEKGNDALSNSKWDDAIHSGRVALKLGANDNRARLLMARANLGKGVYDMAQKYAEDAYAAEPTNAVAMNTLGSVLLQKAFGTYSRSGDKAETIAIIRDSLTRASELRRKVLDAAVDQFTTIDDKNRMAYCDALLNAGRYSRVVAELEPIFRKDMKNNDVVNRYIYALMRGGRIAQAAQAFDNVKKYGAHDGYGFGLRSCFSAYIGDLKDALESEKEAILDDPSSIGVKTAQAFLALRRADTKSAANILNALANNEGHSPVINYDIAALAFMTADFDMSRDRFQTALLAEPTSYDMLVERANQSIFFSLRTDISDDADYGKRQRQLAGAFLDGALAARPESFEALTGQCILALLDGRKEDAVKMGKAATLAGSEYAAAQWAYCAALFEAGRRDEAKNAAKAAAKLDPKGLEGLSYPTAELAWRYFYNKGRTPLLMNPGS